MEKVIQIQDLSYSYPDGTAALSNINLDIYEGESVGVIGPNGAGKSTLLLHLNGILRGNGSIKILDKEIDDANLSFVRKNVGVVFQDPDNQLFMPTVFDDVAFGPINMDLSRDEINNNVQEALFEVDMEGFEERSSHHLSEGQKRRISIATVLSMNPMILCLDEPTSNLDPKHRRDIINFLKERPITKVIATHDLELVAEVCSRLVLMNEGEIIVQGKTQEILGNRELLEENNLEQPRSYGDRPQGFYQVTLN